MFVHSGFSKGQYFSGCKCQRRYWISKERRSRLVIDKTANITFPYNFVTTSRGVVTKDCPYQLPSI